MEEEAESQLTLPKAEGLPQAQTRPKLDSVFHCSHGPSSKVAWEEPREACLVKGRDREGF